MSIFNLLSDFPVWLLLQFFEPSFGLFVFWIKDQRRLILLDCPVIDPEFFIERSGDYTNPSVLRQICYTRLYHCQGILIPLLFNVEPIKPSKK